MAPGRVRLVELEERSVLLVLVLPPRGLRYYCRSMGPLPSPFASFGVGATWAWVHNGFDCDTSCLCRTWTVGIIQPFPSHIFISKYYPWTESSYKYITIEYIYNYIYLQTCK